jgi:hypothetical protein
MQINTLVTQRELQQVSSQLKREISQIRKLLRTQNYQRSWIKSREMKNKLCRAKYNYKKLILKSK